MHEHSAYYIFIVATFFILIKNMYEILSYHNIIRLSFLKASPYNQWYIFNKIQCELCNVWWKVQKTAYMFLIQIFMYHWEMRSGTNFNFIFFNFNTPENSNREKPENMVTYSFFVLMFMFKRKYIYILTTLRW